MPHIVSKPFATVLQIISPNSKISLVLQYLSKINRHPLQSSILKRGIKAQTPNLRKRKLVTTISQESSSKINVQVLA